MTREYRSARELPGRLKRRHGEVQKAIQREREERDDTPEEQEDGWGPKRIKRIVKRDPKGKP